MMKTSSNTNAENTKPCVLSDGCKCECNDKRPAMKIHEWDEEAESGLKLVEKTEYKPEQ
jgi:hypothetical protein